MKWLLPTLLVALSMPVISTAQTSQLTEDPALSHLVNSVMKNVSGLHPGMPRSALAPLFTEDGGLRAIGEAPYDYRPCPSIKIKVKFKPAHATVGPMREERGDDIIIEVSQPYLENPVAD